MAALNKSEARKLLRYWMTGDIAIVEWCDEAGNIDRSKYTTAEHTCPGQRDKTYFDLELLDGERATDLEDDIFDILTRYESWAIAQLYAGELSDARPRLATATASTARRSKVAAAGSSVTAAGAHRSPACNTAMHYSSRTSPPSISGRWRRWRPLQ